MDLDAVEKNPRRMSAYCRDSRLHLRPCTKAGMILLHALRQV